MSNPAFGGSPVTPNQAFDPSQDKTTPNLRSLNQGGMSSPAALAGTTGAEVELVHGDWQQQIDGSGTVSILKNLTTTITLKETRTVVGNLIHKVVGTTSDTRIGIHHQW